VPVDIVVRVQGQTELLQIVGALGAGCSLADLLNGRQQETNQDGNNRDHHKQFDQREGITLTVLATFSSLQVSGKTQLMADLFEPHGKLPCEC
jgi:hypothetical protein